MENSNDEFKKHGFEKANFVVGLSAALLALYPFQEVAKGIKINLFNYDLSLFVISGFFLLLLFISVYFYGLNNIRYGYGFLLTDKRFTWLKSVEIIANSAYVLAFLFPLSCIILWIVSFILNHANLVTAFGFRAASAIDFISVIIAIVASLITSMSYRRNVDEKLKELKEISSRNIAEAEKEDRNGEPALLIMSLHEALMASIKSFLVNRIGLSSDRFPYHLVIRSARDLGLISEEEFSWAMDLRGLRNQIAHTSNIGLLELTSEKVHAFKTKIQPIINRLEKQS